MPANRGGINEVTAPIEFTIEGDRLHATITSGPCVRTYALRFFTARSAAVKAQALLDDHEGQQRVVPMRGESGRH